MLILIIGFCMLLALFTAVYLGFKSQYNASEGQLALFVLLTLFLGIAFIIYGLLHL